MARLYIAYLKLETKQPAEGIKLAQEALQRNPRFPMGHYILVVFCWITERQISPLANSRGLLLAARRAKFYFALSRAYARAKRKEDAERARQTFLRLSQQAEQVRGGGLGVDETVLALIRPSDGKHDSPIGDGNTNSLRM